MTVPGGGGVVSFSATRVLRADSRCSGKSGSDAVHPARAQFTPGLKVAGQGPVTRPLIDEAPVRATSLPFPLDTPLSFLGPKARGHLLRTGGKLLVFLDSFLRPRSGRLVHLNFGPA